MVRELMLAVLGLVVGCLFSGWATFMLVNRVRATKDGGGTARRVPLGLLIVFLLIGLADTFKAISDLIAVSRRLVKEGAHLAPTRANRPMKKEAGKRRGP